MKKIKKKRIIKRIKTISIIIVVVLLGIVGLMIYNNYKYMNSAKGCDAGYYFANFIVKSGCRECPKGQYCPGDNKTYRCPTGLTTARTKSKYASDCKNCRDESKYLSNGQCVSCEIGYYCSSGHLNKCPRDKTTVKKGTKSYKDCVCGAGTYESGASCLSCPKCNGNVTCFTSKPNSKAVTACTGTVPAGKYIKCSSSGCTVKTCPTGTYSQKKSVKYSEKLSTACSKCEKNKIPNASHTKCLCASGTYTSGNTCKSCPKCNGNVTCFTSRIGAKSSSECTGTVPAGKYIKCSGSGCTVKDCTGNTYSTKKSVKYSSKLETKCTSCGSKKANSTHTKCI